MTTTKKDAQPRSLGLFKVLESYFDKRQGALFFISLLLIAGLSLLLFQVNVSIGGDDSYYILRAFRFVQDWTYPSFQGPLYPIVLSPFIALFGLNVILLKFLSVLFTAAFLYFFYKAYRNRVSSFIMVLSMIFLAVNYQVLYYASQTYNEAFHAMLQALFLGYFFHFYDTMNGRDANLREDITGFIWLGIFSLFIILSKNAGLTVIMSICALFFLERRWKALAFTMASFGVIYGIYFLIKSMLSDAKIQMADQGSVLLLKDPYDLSKGNEDMMGFLNRLVDNSHAYLSKNILRMTHLRPEDSLGNIELLTVVIYGLMVAGLFIWFRKNKYLFFTGLFVLITFVTTFIIVQTRWDSERLIFILLPLFIIYMLATLRELIGRLKFKLAQPVFFIVCFLLVFSNFTHSTGKIDLLRLKKNIAGDKYLGYTMDWQNYLKMSEWTSKNLPEGSYVACRKAGMSSIYADGKEFFNITRVFSNDADTLLDALENNKVTHVIMARLRRNPKEKTQYTINTIQRYLYFIEKQYPGTFIPIHQEGSTNNEEANLFYINYNVRRSHKGLIQH